MNPEKLIIPGLTATTAMTGYSYLAAKYEQQAIQLPKVLGLLLKDVLPGRYQDQHQAAGWLTHYAIGIGWAGVCRYAYGKLRSRSVSKDMLVIGFTSGITAITVWKLMFKLHPKPPHTPMPALMRHLFIAHIIYGAVLTLFFQQEQQRLSA